jgi:type IV secretory pathway VirB2 component (pilin)
MLSFLSGRSNDTVKLPNHTFLYGVILATLGVLVALGSVTRLYELREFFPVNLPDHVSEFISSYIPFILGTFITTVAALAGLIVGLNWIFGGMREMSRLRIVLQHPGDYYRPENVSLGLKEGRLRSYDRAPSLIFFLLGRLWSNARYIAEIPGEIVRRNIRFIWKAAAMGIAIHFVFRLLNELPSYIAEVGIGSNYVVPSPTPFYNLLIAVCVLKFMLTLSLIPLKKPGASREMDSMIVEGKGHPSVFFAVLEEGSKVFAHKGFYNRISRSRPVSCDDGETLIGTLVESFPEYVKTSSRPAALISLLLGSVMILVGFLQIILMQYPAFSVGYEEFFRLYLLSLVVDIILGVSIILIGKSFVDQARSLMSVYRFRSSLVYVEAKGDFEREVLPDLKGILSPERLFNPLSSGAFNVRYFSAEAISEAITPDGVRELVGLETSARLAKDVGRLKYLPFQINFVERYPSSWDPEPEEDEEQVVAAMEAETEIGIPTEPESGAPVPSSACR